MQFPGPLHPSSQQRGIILTTGNGKEWDMAETSPMSAQIQGSRKDGVAVTACWGLSPFWGQPLCSHGDFPRDYRSHFTLLIC